MIVCSTLADALRGGASPRGYVHLKFRNRKLQIQTYSNEDVQVLVDCSDSRCSAKSGFLRITCIGQNCLPTAALRNTGLRTA